MCVINVMNIFGNETNKNVKSPASIEVGPQEKGELMQAELPHSEAFQLA
jgi:hypothetical protein